jgi:hypothetical protein
MKHLSFLFFVLVLALGCGEAKAQVTARIELPSSSNIFGWVNQVLPMGRQGLVVEGLNNHDGNRYLKSVFCSTSLKQLYADSVAVNKHAYFDGIFYEGRKCYTVLGSWINELQLVTYDPSTHKTTIATSQYPHHGIKYDKTVLDHYFVFTSVYKKQHAVGIIDFKDGNTKLCDLKFENVKDKDIDVLNYSMVNGVIHALVNAGGKLYLMKISTDGRILSSDNLTTNIDENIHSAKLSKAGGKTFITGTFSVNKKNVSQGIYFGQMENDRITSVKFYNFTDLKNFYNYLSEGKQNEIAEKKAKAEKNDKVLVTSYNIKSHDVLTDGKYYYYLGEAFYPVTTTQVSMGAINTFFSGFEYTHSVLAKFDGNGNLLWDQCFPLHVSDRPIFINYLVSASFVGNNIQLVYTDGNKLMKKLVASSDGHEVRSSNARLETDSEDDKVKKSNSTNLPWYDNNFLVYGNQTVRNQQTGESRKVFAITKYTLK